MYKYPISLSTFLLLLILLINQIDKSSISLSYDKLHTLFKLICVFIEYLQLQIAYNYSTVILFS